MVKREFTDLELQAQILYSLYIHGKWSEIYTNYTRFKKRVSSAVKNNGKNTDRQVGKLIKERLILSRKNGDAIALNPYVKNVVKDRIKLGGFEL
ncbi:hypothetical protein [Nitrosopumilus sp.]|uniref:hypothetical protein n=1 Tax=Nitrosopumilus sp. TaxID=2024843 RepID=UPI00293081E6|nr:hypothetical protein [Nitrosopumilus sp.]